MSEDMRFDKKFPNNVSINDLCDCGRHKTHHETHQPQERGPFPKSDYMLTYKAVQNPKPRSSKRPPLIVREPWHAPMYFSTNQRDDFIDHGKVERMKPIVHADKFEPSTQPLDGVSYYTQEFTPKQIHSEPVYQHTARPDLINHNSTSFDGTTMNKEHFKRWVPQPSLSFGELPSFADSIIFPGKGKFQLSTMKQSYLGESTPSVVLMKGAPDSLKLEGDQSFDTTHSLTYRQIEGDHRPKRLIHSDSMPFKKQGQFMGVSQTKQDFPGYQGNQPHPPKPVTPPQPVIDLTFDNKVSFTTENRTKFQGHNVKEHPAPVSCKEIEEYKLPSVKFEVETSQKRDYKPFDLKIVENRDVKLPLASLRTPKDAQFDGRTMNNKFFQNWRAQPRIRYGDFHENRPYFPPKEPFDAQTITKTSFIHQSVDQRRIFQPKQRPLSKSGVMSFKTEYRDEFQKKQACLCPAAVFLMQQKLKQNKAEHQQLLQLQNKCPPASDMTHTISNTRAAA